MNGGDYVLLKPGKITPNLCPTIALYCNVKTYGHKFANLEQSRHIKKMFRRACFLVYDSVCMCNRAFF